MTCEIQSLRLCVTLIKSKAEMDDFVKGLKVMGVFEAVLNYPTFMKPFFVIVNDKKLNKGMLTNHKKHVLVFVYGWSKKHHFISVEI